jgi:hypothetical protein
MSSAGLPGQSGVGAPLPNPTGQSPRAAVPVSNARAEASRERREVARAENPRRQGALRPECAPARHAGREARRPSGRGWRRVRRPRGSAVRGAGACRRAPLPGDVGGRPWEPGAQALLARRVAVAAWRLARADQIEAELFEEHHHPGGGRGLALIRDGNGPRSFETRWPEPAPTSVVGAFRPTAIAARRWRSSGARCAR